MWVMPNSASKTICLANSIWDLQDFAQPLRKFWRKRKKQGKRGKKKKRKSANRWKKKILKRRAVQRIKRNEVKVAMRGDIAQEVGIEEAHIVDHHGVVRDIAVAENEVQ